MAFDDVGLKLFADGGAIGSGDGSCKCLYHYATNDAASVVEADGYFDAIDGDPLNVGDIIIAALDVDGTPDVQVYIVTVGEGDVTIERVGGASGGNSTISFNIPQTELLAGTSIELIAPIAGNISKLTTIVQTAVTTGGTVTVLVATVAVDGLTITVADAATKGTVQSDTPTAGHASTLVAVGDRIEIVPSAGFATAGALSGTLEITPA